ncbi:MAG: PP2C family protein-serine/threonine phosphatase [Phycisphaerales bacterium]
MADNRRMQCMEIWGGNEPARRTVATAGLDVWVSSDPYDGAASGGDLHFVSSCASGRITRFILADVSGHGEAIAGAAREVRDLMRQHINHVDQTRFVSTLNRRFADVGAGDLFATAVVATYFLTSRTMSICSAGHPLPLIHRRSEGTWSMIPHPARGSTDLANIPLGVLPSIPYHETNLKIAPGDALLCYTDAISEARDADGRMLGVPGLLDMLEGLDPDDDAFLDRLGAAVADYRGGRPDDDESLLLVRGNATGTRWADTLLAPLRLAGEGFARKRRGANDSGSENA